MERKTLARKVMGQVDLDLCFSCRSIWFDRYESLQLEAASVIELFRTISAHSHDQWQPVGYQPACPRCGDPLVTTMDRAKSGAFNYLRCRQQHGHLIVFSQFMIEKGFIRQLGGAELDRLKTEIGIIRCAGCGSPIDIRKDSACPYCHAPIAILDPEAIEAALAGYQKEADRKTQPTDGRLVADYLMDQQRALNLSQEDPRLHNDMGDLLIDGVAAAWRLLKL